MTMQMPEKVILKRRGNYRMGCAVMAVCLFFLALALGAAVFTGAKSDDLILPAAALGAIALVIPLFIWVGIAISVMIERRQIRNLFAGELWAQWQYTPQEW